MQSELRPYYDKINDLSVIVALAQRQLPKRPSDISEDCWRVVLRCCNVDPQLRASLDGILNSLDRLPAEVLYAKETVPSRFEFHEYRGSRALAEEYSNRSHVPDHTRGTPRHADSGLDYLLPATPIRVSEHALD